MSRKPKVYHIEFNPPNDLGWLRNSVTASRSRQYCEGWVDAMDSLYPSWPHRIVATYADGSIEVLRETPGRAKPHVN